MPISANTFRLLREAGVSPEALEAIVASIDDDMGFRPGGKTSRQEINRRYYEKRKERVASETSELRPLNKTSETSELRPPSRADTQTNNSSVPIQENKKEEKGKGGADAPLALLSAVIDPDRAQAVIDHRKRLGKGKALTPGTAKSLAKRLAEFPDPNAAADEMMLRGWTSINANWESARQSTGPPAGRPSENGWGRVLRKLDEDDDEERRGRQIEGIGHSVPPGEATH